MIIDISKLLHQEQCFHNATAPSCFHSKNVSNAEKLILRGQLLPASTCDVTASLWQWYLRDSSGTIQVLVRKRDLFMYESEIICTKWNFIYNETLKARWLEIEDFTYLSSPDQSTLVSEVVPATVVDVVSAVQLAHVRKKIGLENINVLGKVLCCTEIFRYRNKEMCFIEIGQDTTVLKFLIQKPDFLHWPLLIQAAQTYIFSALRVSTAFKGTENEITVFVPTRRSAIREPEDNLKISTTQEFIDAHVKDSEIELKDLQAVLTTRDKDETNTYQERAANTCDYSGVITSCKYKNMGVYEMDHKIRLYVNAANAQHGFTMLREGLNVTLRNVHVTNHTQGKHVAVYMCRRSSLLFNQFPLICDPSSDVHLLMNKVTWSDDSLLHQEWVVDSTMKLMQTLSRALVKEKDVTRIIEQILSASIEPANHALDVPGTLSLNHVTSTCPVTSQERKSLPCLQSVSDLKRFAVESLSNKIPISPPAAKAQKLEDRDSVYWVHIQVTKEQLECKAVVGQIKLNKQTAHIQLLDRSGSIELVPISRDPLLNDASSQPCCGNTKSAEVSKVPHDNCDFVHSKDFGCLVMVKKFDLIVEWFVIDNQAENVQDAPYDTKLYLRFSMKDVLRLSKPKINTAVLKPCTENNACVVNQTNCDYTMEVSGNKSTGKSVIQKVSIVDKESLVVKPYGNTQRLCFLCTTIFIGDCQVIDSPVGDNLTDIGNQKENAYPDEKGKEVVLSFEGDSAKWYHVLQSGGVYCFVKPSSCDKTCFDASYTSQVLKRGMAKTRARELVRVPEDVLIFDVQTESKVMQNSTESPFAEHTNIIPRVQDIVQSSDSAALVSVHGVVKQRRHYENRFGAQRMARDSSVLQNLGASVPGNRCIRIILKDIEDPSSNLSIYINSQYLSYPLGLVPGAHVVFSKLEAKTSAKGQPYYQFLTSSSLRIIGHEVKPLHIVKKVEPQIDQSAIPTYLSEILHHTDTKASHQVLVSVQRVLNLILSSQCATCRQTVRVHQEEVITPCACVRPEIVVHSKASVMIEDGTSNAIVQCVGDHVFSLLALTGAQTDALKTLVCREGHLELYKNDKDLTTSTSFLKLLCTSVSVRRRVVMRVKKFSFCQAWHDISLTDVKYRRVGSGELGFETLSLPLIGLECLGLEEINPVPLSTALLCT